LSITTPVNLKLSRLSRIGSAESGIIRIVFDDSFLRRFRRRWIAWRMAECSGICAAVAAGVGLFIVPILLWRDQPALECAMILLSIGALAGFLWACIHRPTILQTAGEIDRQLQLHDLLSTALRFDASHDAAFAAIVIRQAEARCAEISPSQLILYRLGSRAWGGIGLVTALLLSVAMLSAHPYLSDAQAASPSSNFDSQGSDSAHSPQQIAIATAPADPITDHSLNSGDPASAADSFADAGHRTQSPTHFSSSDATGSAAGRSSDGKNSFLKQVAPHDAIVTQAGDPASSETAVGGATSASTPAWRGGDWSADQINAMQEIRSGQIPTADRDLVREYFALPAKSSR
jgi:hypothetical protein